MKKSIILLATLGIGFISAQETREKDTIKTANLNEVIITGVERVTARESDYVGKLPLKNLENAQVYTGITEALIKQQKLYNVKEVVSNAPGINYSGAGFPGLIRFGGSSFISRGFDTKVRALNGMSADLNLTEDIQNINKIEVIKGPSATLFGNFISSYGGLINRVTKKPFKKLAGSADLSGGNFGYMRLGIDLNTPLNSDKTFLARWNASVQNQGVQTDNGGYTRSLFFAPSFRYKPSERLTINLNTEINQTDIAGVPQGIGLAITPTTVKSVLGPALIAQGFDEQTVQGILAPIPPTIKEAFGTDKITELNLERNRSFIDKSLGIKSTSVVLNPTVEYKISDQWTSRTNALYAAGSSEGYLTRIELLPNFLPALLTGLFSNGVPAYGTPGADYIARGARSVNSTLETMQLQQNFVGDFNIGNMRNRMVIGLDALTYQNDFDFTTFVGSLFGFPYPQYFDTLDRTAEEIPTYYNFTKRNVDQKIQNNPSPYTTRLDRRKNYAVYVNDVLNLTDQLILNAGLRVDYFDNKGTFNAITNIWEDGYNQTALSPKFGLIYQAVKDKVSVFANYQTSFLNQTGQSKDGKSFRPEFAKQFEGGVKYSLFDDLFTGSVSYYHITVDNILRNDPEDFFFFIQDGTQISKGFEAEILGNPTPNLNILAGYAYNDSKLTKADAIVNGLRPASSGPEQQFNLWAHYHFSEGMPLGGFSIGAGMNYVGQTVIFNQRPDGALYIPSYTLANAKISYDKEKYSLTLRINNLLDENIWTGSFYVENLLPRQFVGSIAIKF